METKEIAEIEKQLDDVEFYSPTMALPWQTYHNIIRRLLRDRADDLPRRVCKTLEGIAMLEMGEDEFQSQVYRWCHVARRPTCEHDDWIADFIRNETEIDETCKAPAKKRIKATRR